MSVITMEKNSAVIYNTRQCERRDIFKQRGEKPFERMLLSSTCADENTDNLENEPEEETEDVDETVAELNLAFVESALESAFEIHAQLETSEFF